MFDAVSEAVQPGAVPTFPLLAVASHQVIKAGPEWIMG
jgi:hypothetical protein